MTPYEELRTIHRIMERKYPDIGLTFGYIGNCGPGFGDTKYDDRNWYFFTKVYKRHHNYDRWTFGGYETCDLALLVAKARDDIDDWCARVNSELKKG